MADPGGEESSCGRAIDRSDAPVRTITRMREVLGATQTLECAPSADDAQRSRWLEGVVQSIRYRGGLCGVVWSPLRPFSRYPRAQVTRRVMRAASLQALSSDTYAPAYAFAQRFTAADGAQPTARSMDATPGCFAVQAPHPEPRGPPRPVRPARATSLELPPIRASPRYRPIAGVVLTAAPSRRSHSPKTCVNSRMISPASASMRPRAWSFMVHAASCS